jgi:hypothetical protein
MSLWQTIKSVLSAFFGVQSTDNRERDFKKGNPVVFLIVGLAITIVFLGSILSLVKVIT